MRYKETLPMTIKLLTIRPICPINQREESTRSICIVHDWLDSHDVASGADPAPVVVSELPAPDPARRHVIISTVGVVVLFGFGASGQLVAIQQCCRGSAAAPAFWPGVLYDRVVSQVVLDIIIFVVCWNLIVVWELGAS